MRPNPRRFEEWLREIAATVDDPWRYGDDTPMQTDAAAFLRRYDALIAAARRATYAEQTAHLAAVMREDVE
jgi:hypothetical protein